MNDAETTHVMCSKILQKAKAGSECGIEDTSILLPNYAALPLICAVSVSFLSVSRFVAI